MREFLVISAIDKQAVGGQVVFGHETLHHRDQVLHKRVGRGKFRKRTDILFGQDDHVKGVGRLRVLESQQGIGLTQAFGRDGEAHVCNNPTGQEPSNRRIRQPEKQVHQQSPTTTFPSSIEVIQASDSTGMPSG